MANEFTRKETVADYQTYAGQKDSQIDFSAEADKITTAVKKVATDRETKKKKIQTETDDILTQLAKAEAYSSQTVQQTVLMQANNIKRDVLQFYKDVKIGKRKLADYQAYMQTSRDSIIKSGIAAKHWEENFIEQEARQKLGEDGIKIASGTETYISLNVFGDNILKNSVPYSSPSGEQFLVTMNVDENGTKTMPDFDTERHKYKPGSSMQLWQNYQDDGNKYDIASLVKKSNANIGTFITSRISGYTTSDGGGVVMTREGAQQMDEYLNTTDGKKAFDLLMEDTVAVVLSSDLSVANALEQRSKAGPGKYIIAQTEKEFREKGGTDLSKFLRIVATDKPPTYPDLTEEQRNVAAGMVEREFLTQLGQSTKNTKGMPGQQDTASTSGTETKDIDDAGYISEINDIFTNPNTAKSKAIIKRLVDSRNAEATTPEDRIRAINIEEERIIVKRGGGLDDLIIDRISDSGIADDPNTPDVDESIINISTEDDVMSLIDILTPGKKGFSRSRVRKLIESQNITLGEKRAGGIDITVARTPLPLMTNTTELPSGESILSSFQESFGSTTRGNLDGTIIKAIDDAIVGAMTKTLKRNISEYGLGDAKTKKVKIDGKDYLNVTMAGFERDILLDDNNTKEAIAGDIVGIINEATKLVNEKRAKGEVGGGVNGGAYN